MPIYMDLHIAPGIKAKEIAEAHVKDLQIQDNYQCNCMTYWVDESNGRAFCLINAPSEEAVKNLHEKAHGFIPHHIVQVDKIVVESFLGRIYDPEPTQLKEGELHVFNDPAFRVLVLINVSDSVILTNKLGSYAAQQLLSQYLNCIHEKCHSYDGKIAEHNENVTTILSFKSVVNAVDCAFEIQNGIPDEGKKLLNLKLSINAGMPVVKSNRLFGDTIDTGTYLLYLAHPTQMVMGSIISEKGLENSFNKKENNWTLLSPSEEKLLEQLFTILEKNSGKEDFDVDTFCKHMAMSKTSLNRVTQALTHRSPNALLKEYRLDRAYHLLRKSKDDIAGVSFKAGFNSPSYFSKCFKKHFEVSPSDYAAQLKR